MSRKSRTASYLALGRIWHDTGADIRCYLRLSVHIESTSTQPLFTLLLNVSVYPTALRRRKAYTSVHSVDKIKLFCKINKKHLKNVGPIRYCEPPLHCQSPGVASRTPAIATAQAACDVHDNNNNNNDNA